MLSNSSQFFSQDETMDSLPTSHIILLQISTDLQVRAQLLNDWHSSSSIHTPPLSVRINFPSGLLSLSGLWSTTTTLLYSTIHASNETLIKHSVEIQSPCLHWLLKPYLSLTCKMPLIGFYALIPAVTLSVYVSPTRSIPVAYMPIDYLSASLRMWLTVLSFVEVDSWRARDKTKKHAVMTLNWILFTF